MNRFFLNLVGVLGQVFGSNWRGLNVLQGYLTTSVGANNLVDASSNKLIWYRNKL